ncbi:glutathione peroxidase [Terriglobus albidus]|uniref:glutathione peroxidase n=1 Tax=Terriglobus albidus TaxID=1592106 RepID=UPI0021E0E574|nr:glutathione peroxidase [Terriglobus albidus]
MANLQTIPLETITNQPTTLAEYVGKVLLIVNVASKCGLTPQYSGLESLYERFHDRGLVVLGFPANDFGGQEPGTNQEIAKFCSLTYDVSFPMFAKIGVTGPGKHPLYQELTKALPQAISTTGFDFAADLRNYGTEPNEPPELLWNFEKFLISRTGEPVARFAPDTTPDDPALIAAIEAELEK